MILHAFAIALLDACARPALAASADPLATPSRGSVGALDLLLMLFLAYLAWRLISRLINRDDDKDRDDSPNPYDMPPDDQNKDISPRERRSRAAQAAWEYLTGEKGPDLQPRPTPVEGGFNEAEFLRGAKLMYGRIRQSFAKRDMADLRQFTAPEMMHRFEEANSKDSTRKELAVLLVEAAVQDVVTAGGKTRVSVAYEATINDSPDAKASRTTQETWVFVRDDALADAKWLLESIQEGQPASSETAAS